MAFPDGWNHKCLFTIPIVGVPGDQTDFPVMLIWNGTSGNLPSEIYNAGLSSPMSDGRDIRFSVDTEGTTQLPFEIVTFSPNSTVANARVEIWVKLTSISSSTPTTFYIWWSNSQASALPYTDTYGRNNVWTNNYLGVWHLNEPSGSTAVNSVGSNDGTYSGTSFPNQVDTSYGYMQNFVNANTNYVSIGTGSPWQITGNITLSAIVTVSSWTTAWQALIAKGDWTYRISRNDSYNYPTFDRTSSSGTQRATHTTSIATGYHHIVGMFNTSVGSYCYVDGVAGTLNNNTEATLSDAKNLCIGRNTDNPDRDWNGYMGKVRIVNAARSSTWITMEYNTILDFSTFITAGTPEDVLIVKLELGCNF